MTKSLIYYGHPGLRKKCEKVQKITDDIYKISQQLIEVVLDKNGAGLAASQINEHIRIFVICYDNDTKNPGKAITCSPKIYINPILSNPSKETTIHKEGCLSIPGIYEKVERPHSILLKAIDLNGHEIVEEATGWRARAIMHENDHLNGMLFIDRIPLKMRKKIEPALKQIKKKWSHIL